MEKPNCVVNTTSTDTNTAKHFDDGKVMLGVFPGRAYEEVCKVIMYGEEKYGKDNWQKGMPWSQLLNSAFRHLVRDWFWRREDIDKESGLPHLAHAMCNIAFLIEYSFYRKKYDDRPNIYKEVS